MALYFLDFIKYMALESNKSVKKLVSNNLCLESDLITGTEITKFIGITILMGIIKLPNIKMYWGIKYK